jgi:ribose transport system permease protein
VALIAVLRNGLNLMSVQADVQTIVLGFVILAAVLIDIVRNGTFSKVKKINPEKGK